MRRGENILTEKAKEEVRGAKESSSETTTASVDAENYMISALYHELILCRVRKSVLSVLDSVIRRFVRVTLRWPKDTRNELVHAYVDDGGLGVP